MQNGYDFEGYAADVSRTITKARKLSNRGSGVLSNRLRGKVGYIGTSMGAIVGAGARRQGQPRQADQRRGPQGRCALRRLPDPAVARRC